MTTPVLRVVAVLLTDITVDRYGMDLIQDTGLASGTLYPILVRLERAGWVSAGWKDTGPSSRAGPPAATTG
jgi:PadR family transcriptional regulator PadR